MTVTVTLASSLDCHQSLSSSSQFSPRRARIPPKPLARCHSAALCHCATPQRRSPPPWAMQPCHAPTAANCGTATKESRTSEDLDHGHWPGAGGVIMTRHVVPVRPWGPGPSTRSRPGVCVQRRTTRVPMQRRQRPAAPTVQLAPHCRRHQTSPESRRHQTSPDVTSHSSAHVSTRFHPRLSSAVLSCPQLS